MLSDFCIILLSLIYLLLKHVFIYNFFIKYVF